MRRHLLVACAFALLAPAVSARESVLYSITDQSITYPVTNRLVSGSIPEYKTDIFAIDSETGKKRLIFSDANAEFMLLPGGTTLGRGGVAAAGARIFSVAANRRARANGVQEPDAIYELSTDGSGKARKVLAIEDEAQNPNFGNIFVSPSGPQIAYTNYIGGKHYLFIDDMTTGKLLRKTALKYSSEERTGWRFGSPGGFGWLPDGKRIFFAIALSGDSDDAFWTALNSPVGTYVMNEDSSAAERLAPEAALHPKVPGMEPSPDTAAVLIGVLPDGEFLLSDVEYGPVPGHRGTYLYALDLAKKTQKIFPLQVNGDPGSFHLSPSGNKLALTANPSIVAGQPRLTAKPTVDVWVLDLESGKQIKLCSFAPTDVTGTKGPWINLVGWLEDQ